MDIFPNFGANSGNNKKTGKMNEAVIKYEDKNTLAALEAIGKLLGFTVAAHKEDVEDYEYINGVPMTKRDSSITFEDMVGSLTGMGLNARTIREEAWKKKM